MSWDLCDKVKIGRGNGCSHSNLNPGPHVHWIYSNYLRTGRGVIMKIDSNRELKSPGFGRCVFHSCRGVPISQCNGFTNVHYNFSVFSNASVSSTAEGGGGWVRGGCFKIRGSVGGEGGGGNGLFWTSDRSPGATTTERRTLPAHCNNNPRNSNCNPNYFKPSDQECCSNICVDHHTFIPALLNNALASAKNCGEKLYEYFHNMLKYAGKWL